MNRPPIWMNVRIRDDERNFGLFIPLFLLLPILFLVLLALSPLILIGVLVTWPSGWGKLALKALWAGFGLFSAMRGFQVDVRGPRQVVKVSVV